MSETPKVPTPRVNPETKPFWDATQEGKFLIKHCNACSEHYWYPRTMCPLCHSTDTTWRQSSGRGKIYSYSVMRRAPVPYAMAFVTLEEGITVMTNIVDCDLDSIAIDQPVRVIFRQSEDGAAVPYFTPA
ncbi:MAG: OB-fold domain-containing protein [Myxococcales bacterium]|nr:OB-fold domain-containing protein [Myxococcales bacterium]MDD9965391.1 OB-fold domain-containing protein [Myxococcales bacterium]